MKRFADTVTLITGASSGIGAALSVEIARQGGDVVLIARRKERLQELARKIESTGRRALAIQADIANDGDIELAVKKTNAEFGRIDYVVANAGFGVAGRFEKLTIEDFRRQFETNVFGVLRTVYATRENLVASRGCLGIIGSINGYIATPRLSAYAMSKFAVHGLAESLRYEFRPHGVGVVLIVPGFIQTEIRQVDKMGVYHPEMRDRMPPWLRMPAEKAAQQIADAIYRRKRIRVITGHGAIAVFLQRHCPGLLSAVMYPLSRKGPLR
jgi:short-subunit dehydrogenase